MLFPTGGKAMDYVKEINKMLSTVTQESVLRFICSFVRIITTDEENVSVIEYLTQLFGSE